MTRMTRVNIGIAEFAVSANPEEYLITVGLGSCLAVLAYDSVARVGAMVHVKLPLSRIDPVKAQTRPGMFVDTAVPEMFRMMAARGCSKANLSVKLVGGASMYDDGGYFDVGERNIVAARRLLWKSRMFIAAEDVGGAVARTVLLQIDTGKCLVRKQSEEFVL